MNTFLAVKLFVPIFQIGSSHSTFILHRHHVVCVRTLTLFTAACFFVRTPSLTIFCFKLIIFESCSSRSILSIPHLFSAVFHKVCHSFLFAPACVCVCLCVIITRPPRGNQQWSLDSPDPLVPQHTCPWGAFPMSSEPLCACGCTICPCAWWRWSGHAGLPTGDLHTHPHSPEEALRMGHKKMTNKHKWWTPRDK